MISLIQRVTEAAVSVEGEEISRIGHGLLILVGIFQEDTESDITKSAEKIANMRIMSDENDKMNRSALDIGSEILLVSQFTLCADHTFGRRPSFIKAMEPEKAKKLFDQYVSEFERLGLKVQTGRFGHYMDVALHNDGPVTIMYDTKK